MGVFWINLYVQLLEDVKSRRRAEHELDRSTCVRELLLWHVLVATTAIFAHGTYLYSLKSMRGSYATLTARHVKSVPGAKQTPACSHYVEELRRELSRTGFTSLSIQERKSWSASWYENPILVSSCLDLEGLTWGFHQENEQRVINSLELLSWKRDDYWTRTEHIRSLSTNVIILKGKKKLEMKLKQAVRRYVVTFTAFWLTHGWGNLERDLSILGGSIAIVVWTNIRCKWRKAYVARAACVNSEGAFTNAARSKEGEL